MSNSFFSIEAGQRFISSEAQDILNAQILGLPNWKWLGLFAAIICLYFIRIALLWIIIKLKKTQNYFPQRTMMKFFLDQKIEKGLSWVSVCIAALILIESLELPPSFNRYAILIIKLFLSVNIIRTCYMAAEALGLSIQEWTKTTQSNLDNQLAPFASKTIKVLVIITGVLIVLQNFGVNVTALLAGLGIGGVALAFAAQDTVANVFGTITILMDTPFKLGDHVKIGDTEGHVIEIGFRSTHIKTLYNSSVTLPNSVVAKEKIDNLSKRNGWIRFLHTIGFTYDATPQQMKSFSEKIKQHLQLDPTVDRERIAVSFSSFGDSALNVTVSFHFRLGEDENLFDRNSEYLHLIYDISQEQKLSFAYPTQTLILQNKAMSDNQT